MARVKKKRQAGTGMIVREKLGLAIRWPEYLVTGDGRKQRKMRYEFLGAVSERHADRQVLDRIARANRTGPQRERVAPTFTEHVERYRKDILESADESTEMYKYSVRDVCNSILRARLGPRFGAWRLDRMSTSEIQRWVTELRAEHLAAHTIHDYFKVLRLILAAAVNWHHLEANPCTGVALPRIIKGKEKRKKWALTAKQAGGLIGKIRLLKARVMVAVAILAGLRRGELLAVRWLHFDEAGARLQVRQASYRGHIGLPKTHAGVRDEPLHPWLVRLLLEWRGKSKHSRPNDFIFATRNGKMESPGNILNRYVFPACDGLGLPRASWNAFRRTFSSVHHKNGTPAKAIAELMGHANVDTQFIYIQVEEEMKREAAGRIGDELSRFCPDDRQLGMPWVN